MSKQLEFNVRFFVAGAAEALLGDTQIRVPAPNNQRGRDCRRRQPQLPLESVPAALFGHVFLHGTYSACALVLHGGLAERGRSVLCVCLVLFVLF